MEKEAQRFLEYLDDCRDIKDEDAETIAFYVKEKGCVSFTLLYDLAIDGDISVQASNKADSILDAVQCEILEKDEDCEHVGGCWL